MAATTPLVWFITGSSVGLGASLALHALKSGHKVIATARNITTASKANPEIESLGGHWMTLDVTSSTSGSVLEEASKVFGPIDVLVNNAGYSLIGAVEDIRFVPTSMTAVKPPHSDMLDSDEEAREQFETNFFGPLRLIRSILPSFRARRSGTIINVSSIAGIDALPTCGLYSGSKFALEGIATLYDFPIRRTNASPGLSESLSREVSDFNIRVLLVEPGAFRTRFLQSTVSPKKETTSDYLGVTVGKTLKHFEALNNKQRGDPVKGAARIFEVVTKSGAASALEKEYLRLPLGADSFERTEKKNRNVKETIEALRAFGTNTDI
jgi:NAD(P)-dependent dehydrogenase (short-subunit alcohol dehydrogenase family)